MVVADFRYEETAITRATTTTSAVETAASVGVTASWMSSHICLGSVVFRPPLTKIATVRSSNDTTKANRNAEIKLGASIGSITVRSLAQGEAPRICAASTSRQSKRLNPAASVTTT